MINKYGLISAATLCLVATGAFAADSKDSADSGIKIQFGIPQDLTLQEAQKQAHERADKLDKTTPQEWEQSQQKFHAFMDKLGKMTPEEKQKLFPDAPKWVAAHLGSPKAAGTALSHIPAVTIETARRQAHAEADGLDKISEKEWNERKQASRELLQNYDKLTPQQRRAQALQKMQQLQQDKGQAPPGSQGAAGKP